MKGIYVKEPLNVLSCAVQGRPGRSAYEAAVSAGYTGTPEEYTDILASLPEALISLNIYNGRVNAILELLGNQIADLELAVEDLETRVSALEDENRGPGSGARAGGTDA